MIDQGLIREITGQLVRLFGNARFIETDFKFDAFFASKGHFIVVVDQKVFRSPNCYDNHTRYELVVMIAEWIEKIQSDLSRGAQPEIVEHTERKFEA